MEKKHFTTLFLIITLLLVATLIFFLIKPRQDDSNNTISFYTFIISNELINKGENPIYITKDSFKKLYTWDKLDDTEIEKITNYFSNYNIYIVDQKDLPTINTYYKIDVKFYNKNTLKYTVEKYYDNKLNSSFGREIEFKKGVWNYSSGIGTITQH